MNTKIDEILQVIHGTIRMQNYRLTKEEIEKADKEILPFLEEFVAPNVSDPKVKVAGNTIPIPKKVILPAILRYYAIVQNTVPLLDTLEKRKYPFEKLGKTIPLYLLDGVLSNSFPQDRYISIISKERGCIKRFMDSLMGASKEEKEYFIKIFADVVLRDPTLLTVGIGHIDEGDNFNLLTRRNFELFHKDFFVNSTRKQREIVNVIYGRLEKEDALKLEELFQKYPNYRPTLPIHAELLKFFTIDELANMSEKDETLYTIAIRRGCVPRVKELLSLKPEFDCPDGVIREEILRSLDNDTILGLTADGLQELAELTIPELNNVTIFPIKKINRVLFHDKLRKMKLKIKEQIVHK